MRFEIRCYWTKTNMKAPFLCKAKMNYNFTFVLFVCIGIVRWSSAERNASLAFEWRERGKNVYAKKINDAVIFFRCQSKGNVCVVVFKSTLPCEIFYSCEHSFLKNHDDSTLDKICSRIIAVHNACVCVWLWVCVRSIQIQCVCFMEVDWHFLWYAHTGGRMKCIECWYLGFFMPMHIHYLIIIIHTNTHTRTHKHMLRHFVYFNLPHHFANHWNWTLSPTMYMMMWCVCQPHSSQNSVWIYLFSVCCSIKRYNRANAKHCSVRWKFLLVFGMCGTSIHGIFDVDPTKARQMNLKYFYN